jgi:hypothetical protein
VKGGSISDGIQTGTIRAAPLTAEEDRAEAAT